MSFFKRRYKHNLASKNLSKEKEGRRKGGRREEKKEGKEDRR